MTTEKRFKRMVREEAKRTGMSYAATRARLDRRRAGHELDTAAVTGVTSASQEVLGDGEASSTNLAPPSVTKQRED